MRFLDQLLLAGSLVPLGAMVLLLWTAFRAPRERPVRESQRAR